MAWWIPVLQAIGMNAGKNILTGQDPLKGTIEAGVTGGVTGGFTGSEIPGAEIAQNPASIIPGSLESEGLLQFNQATGTYLNPSQYTNVLGSPMYTGGQGLLSNVGDELKSSLGDISPQNLLGVASLLDQPDTSAYQRQAGVGGGVSRGSGQGLAVEMPQAKVFKRRKA